MDSFNCDDMYCDESSILPLMQSTMLDSMITERTNMTCIPEIADQAIDFGEISIISRKEFEEAKDVNLDEDPATKKHWRMCAKSVFLTYS